MTQIPCATSSTSFSRASSRSRRSSRPARLWNGMKTREQPRGLRKRTLRKCPAS
nr:MAG TPA: hypothetical protein [Caudoviricetes sp.]